MSSITSSFFVLLSFLFVFNATAQETIRLQDFKLQVENNVSQADTAWAYLQVMTANNLTLHYNFPLLKKENYTNSFKLPANAAFVWVNYYAKDFNAIDKTYYLLDAKNKPMPLSIMYNEEMPFIERVTKELALYPENYNVLIHAIRNDFDGKSFPTTSLDSMLNTINEKNADAQLLKCLIYGKKGDYEMYEKQVTNFIKQNPHKENGFNVFHYVFIARNKLGPNSNIYQNLLKMRFDYIKTNFKSDAVKNLFNGGFNAMGQIDEATLTKNLNQLIGETKNANTIRFNMKFTLLNIYMENNNFKEAEKVALALLNDNDIFHSCMGNAIRMEYTKENIQKSLRYIYHKLGKYEKSLLMTAEIMDKSLNPDKPRFNPTDIFMQERLLGEFYTDMNLLFLAEHTLKNSYKNTFHNDKDELEYVKEAFLNWYKKKEGKRDGFETYMKKMHESIFKDDKNSPSFLEKSMPFSLNLLNGKSVKSDELLGKVVVLNFWDLACAPCIMEMPDLNEVVKHFENNPDVVFLAPTTNAKEKLDLFAKKTTFAYQITYESKAIFEDFALKGWPWHLIINPKGEIMMKQMGSNPNIKTHLIETIEVALKEK